MIFYERKEKAVPVNPEKDSPLQIPKLNLWSPVKHKHSLEGLQFKLSLAFLFLTASFSRSHRE